MLVAWQVCGVLVWRLSCPAWRLSCPAFSLAGCPVLPGVLSCPARFLPPAPSCRYVALSSGFDERTEFPIRETIWVIGTYVLVLWRTAFVFINARRAPPLGALPRAASTCVALLRQTSLFEKYKSMQTCDLLLLSFHSTCSVRVQSSS